MIHSLREAVWMLERGRRAVGRLAQWYCRATPGGVGKGPARRLAALALSGLEVEADSRHGGAYAIRLPEDWGFEQVYFDGTFETGTSEVIAEIVRSDDFVLDVGANFGWYTVLAARQLTTGVCHAFEPVARSFAKLEGNVRRNRLEARTVLNRVGLSERSAVGNIYTFAGLPLGYASSSTLGRRDWSKEEVHFTTVDEYVRQRNLPRVDIVKMDVEGGEMAVLRGAEGLLSAEAPPIWILEMNREAAAAFGERPEHFLEWFSSHGDYRYYRIVSAWGELRPMHSSSDFEHGDNVVCVPEQRAERLRIR